MKILDRVTIAICLAMGVVLSVGGLGSAAHGQTIPNVSVTDPADGTTVNVGPSSSKMKVYAQTGNGFYPVTASLSYGTINGDTTDSFQFLSPIDRWVAELSVPAGTTTGVRITVRAYRPANSDGDPDMFRNDSSEGITTVKED